MKTKFILVAMTLACLMGQAHPKVEGSPQMLLKSQEGFMAPTWSPDGQQLAVTGNNYTGIWIASIDGSGIQQITSDAGAGYKMAWSPESNTILGRTNVIKNGRVLHQLKTYDTKTGKSAIVMDATRNLCGTPTWGKAGEVKFAKKDGAQKIRLSENQASPIQLNVYETMLSYPFEATQLIPSLSEFAGKPIINPSMSPDGSKIAFQIAGKGIFVCAADGSQLKHLGKGSYPSWMPDSKHIVVAEVKDNGEVFTSSKLISFDTESGESALLFENNDMIPVTPAVSPKGNQLAFENSRNGCIYILNLTF